jgi:hypothetical protein
MEYGCNIKSDINRNMIRNLTSIGLDLPLGFEDGKIFLSLTNTNEDPN